MMKNRLYEEPAAILFTLDQKSPVIKGDLNSLLSVFSERLLLRPKCGKMSVNVHPFH